MGLKKDEVIFVVVKFVIKQKVAIGLFFKYSVPKKVKHLNSKIQIMKGVLTTKIC